MGDCGNFVSRPIPLVFRHNGPFRNTLRGFLLEQRLFPLNSPTITGQLSIFADDPVAGNYN